MNLTNEFYNLGDTFYTEYSPERKINPKLLIKNNNLISSFGMQCSDEELALRCSGTSLTPDSHPYALVYAGHQFGSFNPRLGDGRAVSLGNMRDSAGALFEVSLKGSGRTPYSRGGDGMLALGPAMREYLVSEYFRALGIPTTLSLALTTSDDIVLREQQLPAAVLTRISGSFMRVGTFEYFLSIGKYDAITVLLDYLIMHYYSSVQSGEYLDLFRHICQRQANLIAQWQSIGFIHGVMNTDNMSIVGETIDYGPCAFLDEYQSDKVFSSIDRGGRYAFNNQINIGLWNLTSLANCIITQFTDKQSVVSDFEAILADTHKQFWHQYYTLMCNKLAIAYNTTTIDTLLSLLQRYHIDYTNFFVHLTHLTGEQLRAKYAAHADLHNWIKEWYLLRSEDYQKQMQQINPYLIPRNHVIEDTITRANTGDFSLFYELLSQLQSPYSEDYINNDFTRVPFESERVTQTFCGT